MIDSVLRIVRGMAGVCGIAYLFYRDAGLAIAILLTADLVSRLRWRRQLPLGSGSKDSAHEPRRL